MSEKRVANRLWQQRLVAAALLAGLPVATAPVRAQMALPVSPAAEPAPAAAPVTRPARSSGIEMKVRRLPNAVEVVIAGTGPAPQLLQTSRGTSWEGRVLTPAPIPLRKGPQRLALPEAGLQSISLSGSGNTYSVVVTPVPGFPVGRPVVSADGRDLILSFPASVQPSLQTTTSNVTAPGRVAQPSYVPPLQPRAVAPPVGDMAVGTMLLSNPSYVNVSGPAVTMTLKNAPVRDVLMSIARLGNYGFVYVDDPDPKFKDYVNRKISISFRNESYGRAVNSALLAAGLQGRMEGNMLMAGPSALGKSFGAQMSKVYRLNQASADSAADYLANLGALVNKTFTTTSVSQQTQSSGTPTQNTGATQSETATVTQIQSYGASQGPLRGLIGTTDSRLGTITLVGDPRVVAVAEAYLKQLDLRQRQVALSLKILDVDLTNDADINNSFAFRWGNNFIVSDSGQLLGAFGRNLPPGEAAFSTILPGLESAVPNPGLEYPSSSLFDFIRAQIVSQNTKLLASPTLILQENPSLLREDATTSSSNNSSGSGNNDSQQGITNIDLNSPIGRRRANEGVVRVGTNVVTGYETNTPSQGGNIVCTPELTTAGLVLGARVEKIDDNGFVTFTLSPSISAVTDREPAPQGCGSDLNILSVRSLDTGAVRVRDGQTLLLTGVISDLDREEVTKWPILGDFPLIGQFFRSSRNGRQKRELVIMVTPRIINDTEGGAFGYGWQPGTSQSLDLMRSVPR